MKKFLIIGIVFMLGMLCLIAEHSDIAVTILLKFLGVSFLGGVAVLWNVWKIDNEFGD